MWRAGILGWTGFADGDSFCPPGLLRLEVQSARGREIIIRTDQVDPGSPGDLLDLISTNGQVVDDLRCSLPLNPGMGDDHGGIDKLFPWGILHLHGSSYQLVGGEPG